jgi:hypothetical protein
MAAVMAGSILHEKLIRDEMLHAFSQELDNKMDRLSSEAARKVHELFLRSPPGVTGIQLIEEVRRKCGDYYRWVYDDSAQDLFFAGRSVLHRIEEDNQSKVGIAAAKLLLRRLQEGANIRVLFLDPRSSIIERVAKEEGQPLRSMLGDLRKSLKVCRELADLVGRSSDDLPASANLSIMVYDKMPYFAFHKQDNEIIVGFYFNSAKGSTAPAYRVLDSATKKVFEEHFLSVANNSTTSTILEFNGSRSTFSFNDTLDVELQEALDSLENV